MFVKIRVPNVTAQIALWIDRRGLAACFCLLCESTEYNFSVILCIKASFYFFFNVKIFGIVHLSTTQSDSIQSLELLLILSGLSETFSNSRFLDKHGLWVYGGVLAH